MIIKPKFQDLKQSQAIEEKLGSRSFLVNGDKLIVLAVQAFLLGHLIYQFVVDKVYASNDCIPNTICICVFAIVFMAFLFEKKSIIVVYFWTLVLFAAIPIAQILNLGDAVLRKLFNPDAPVYYGPNSIELASQLIMWNLVFLLALVFYLILCFSIIENINLKKKKKAMTLPHTVQNIVLVQPKNKPVQSN